VDRNRGETGKNFERGGFLEPSKISDAITVSDDLIVGDELNFSVAWIVAEDVKLREFFSSAYEENPFETAKILVFWLRALGSGRFDRTSGFDSAKWPTDSDNGTEKEYGFDGVRRPDDLISSDEVSCADLSNFTEQVNCTDGSGALESVRSADGSSLSDWSKPSEELN
jgi:hypothetical protein